MLPSQFVHQNEINQYYQETPNDRQNLYCRDQIAKNRKRTQETRCSREIIVEELTLNRQRDSAKLQKNALSPALGGLKDVCHEDNGAKRQRQPHVIKNCCKEIHCTRGELPDTQDQITPPFPDSELENSDLFQCGLKTNPAPAERSVVTSVSLTHLKNKIPDISAESVRCDAGTQLPTVTDGQEASRLRSRGAQQSKCYHSMPTSCLVGSQKPMGPYEKNIQYAFQTVSIVSTYMARKQISAETLAKEVGIDSVTLKAWLSGDCEFENDNALTSTLAKHVLEESEFEYFLLTHQHRLELRVALERSLKEKVDIFWRDMTAVYENWSIQRVKYSPDNLLELVPTTRLLNHGLDIPQDKQTYTKQRFNPEISDREWEFYDEVRRLCRLFVENNCSSEGVDKYKGALSAIRSGLLNTLRVIRGRVRSDVAALRPACLLLATTLGFVEHLDMLNAYHSTLVAEVWELLTISWRSVLLTYSTVRPVPIFQLTTAPSPTHKTTVLSWLCLKDVIEALDCTLAVVEVHHEKYQWPKTSFAATIIHLRHWCQSIVY